MLAGDWRRTWWSRNHRLRHGNRTRSYCWMIGRGILLGSFLRLLGFQSLSAAPSVVVEVAERAHAAVPVPALAVLSPCFPLCCGLLFVKSTQCDVSPVVVHFDLYGDWRRRNTASVSTTAVTTLISRRDTQSCSFRNRAQVAGPRSVMAMSAGRCVTLRTRLTKYYWWT